MGKEMSAFREVQIKQKGEFRGQRQCFQEEEIKESNKEKELNWVLKEGKIEHEETI